VILLDEPTAVLSDVDAAALLERLEAFRAEGKAIIYVSHRLSEVLRIADRISVLRDGAMVGTFARQEVDREHIITLMAKSEVAPASLEVTERASEQEDTPILEVQGLTFGHILNDVSFSVERGEIVGIAGVQGSGHGYLLGAIAGRLPYDEGAIVMNGRTLDPSLHERYKAGLALVPADRREAAIVPSLTVRDNIVLPRGRTYGRFGIRKRASERMVAIRLASMFLLRPPNIDRHASGLSGGNQQKVALARAVQSGPRVLLLEEPTQGIDVNAKAEIRALIQRLTREERTSVVIATSEFEDLLGLADVIHVMCLGRFATSLSGAEATYERILHHALP
jgi:ABC-type sugar transport system ATPase subunit